MRNYIKIAFKVLLRRKFFTFISLFGISFTMTVLIVVVSFFDHVFGPGPLEVKHERMLYVFELWYKYAPGVGEAAFSYKLSHHAVDTYIRPLERVQGISIFEEHTDKYTHYNDKGDKVDSWLKHVDAAFWEILEFNFLEGDGFSERDVAEANQVAVINEATRRRLFGDQAAVGRTFTVDKKKLRVVGVVDNISMTRQFFFADIWVPYSITRSYREKPLTGGVQDLLGPFIALILTKEKSALAAIKADFRASLSGLSFPDAHRAVVAVDGHAESSLDYISSMLFEDIVDDTEQEGARFPILFMGVIIAFMVAFMVLPAVNLININMSRIMERASEIGVRKSFGASSWMLVCQFVVENVLLTLLGGLIGFIAPWALLMFVNSIELIPHAHFQLNMRIFAAGMMLALFFGVFSGVYPAWRMSRLHPVAALQRRNK